jgi:hypothetical protein
MELKLNGTQSYNFGMPPPTAEVKFNKLNARQPLAFFAIFVVKYMGALAWAAKWGAA